MFHKTIATLNCFDHINVVSVRFWRLAVLVVDAKIAKKHKNTKQLKVTKLLTVSTEWAI